MQVSGFKEVALLAILLVGVQAERQTHAAVGTAAIGVSVHVPAGRCLAEARMPVRRSGGVEGFVRCDRRVTFSARATMAGRSSASTDLVAEGEMPAVYALPPQRRVRLSRREGEEVPHRFASGRPSSETSHSRREEIIVLTVTY